MVLYFTSALWWGAIVTFSSIYLLMNWFMLKWNYGSTIKYETRLYFETLLKQTEIAQEQGTPLNTVTSLPSYQNECSASAAWFGGWQVSGTQKWMREDQNAGLGIVCMGPRNRQNSAPWKTSGSLISLTLLKQSLTLTGRFMVISEVWENVTSCWTLTSLTHCNYSRQKGNPV